MKLRGKKVNRRRSERIEYCGYDFCSTVHARRITKPWEVDRSGDGYLHYGRRWGPLRHKHWRSCWADMDKRTKRFIEEMRIYNEQGRTDKQ